MLRRWEDAECNNLEFTPFLPSCYPCSLCNSCLKTTDRMVFKLDCSNSSYTPLLLYVLISWNPRKPPHAPPSNRTVLTDDCDLTSNYQHKIKFAQPYSHFPPPNCYFQHLLLKTPSFPPSIHFFSLFQVFFPCPLQLYPFLCVHLPLFLCT